MGERGCPGRLRGDGGAAGVAESGTRENEWRRREAGEGARAGAEQLVGESPGPGKGGGGTREWHSGAGAEGARRPVKKGEATGWG